MSFENVKAYFESVNMADRLIVPDQSSATVEEAAAALGCAPKEIAKTISLLLHEKPILIVVAGDAKIDNKKYRDTFHAKARMIAWEEVEDYIGHAPGGVCPFAVKDGVEIYLDVSLKRFVIVYPAAGNGHSAVRLGVEELETYAKPKGWVDVCKGWQEE